MMSEEAALPVFVTEAKEGGWHLHVRVQPGAKKTECVGLMDDRLRIRLAAPAVENKANKELLAFVVRLLGLKTSNVALVSGETGRLKKLHITAVREPDWNRLLPAPALG